MPQAARLEHTMTFDRFLAFLAERPDGERWELVDGKPVMNAQPTDFHQIIAENVIVFLRAHRREHGAPWIPIGPSAVPIPGANRSRSPDVTVKRALTGTQFTPDPITVFEVLSPSNGPQDRTARLSDYRAVPSIEHYVVLHQDRPLATFYSRADGWEGRDVGPQSRTVDLPALGVRMPLSAAYEDTPLDYFFTPAARARPRRPDKS